MSLGSKILPFPRFVHPSMPPCTHPSIQLSICSMTHSFIQQLFISTYYVPITVIGAGEKAVRNKKNKKHKHLDPARAHILAGFLSLRPQGSWPQQTPSLVPAWHLSPGGIRSQHHCPEPPSHLANHLAASLGSSWQLGLHSRASATVACCDLSTAPWQGEGAVPPT